MRRCLFLAGILLVVGAAMAQVQQGVVKTRGRVVNGKLVPGDMIPSAVVSVRGRSAILSGADGSFSFAVAGNSFIVDSVRKKNYALIDMESCRQYKFPQSPFVLLMEKPEVQQAELLAKERRLRRDLQRRLQQREDEVDALNVSLEEKNRLLAEINHDREENEKLIKDLAEYYAKLDYDQLDEFQRRVSECLENGELERADSLLRSRGDMNKRIAEIHAEEAAEAKEKAEVLQRLKDVEISEKGTSKKKEIAAADCYNFHQRFAQDHQRDSAAYYLELRALLDTTNVLWANRAGKYIQDYLADYPKALEYYQRMLRQSLLQFGELDKWTVTTYNNIGCIYNYQGNYTKALEFFIKSLEIGEKVYGHEHSEVAIAYDNIGSVYSNLSKYPEALENHTKALAIRVKVLGKDDPDVAISYNNVGKVYSDQGDYPKALEYFTMSLEIREKKLGMEHPDVALSYNNIGFIYKLQGNYLKALEYYTKALAIWEIVFSTEHPSVALSYNNIGQLYASQGNYLKALEYHTKTLAIREKFYGGEHPDVALSYNNIGTVYFYQGNYTHALEYLTKALAIWEKVFGKEHPQTRRAMSNIEHIKNVKIAQDPVAMQEHVFIATVDDGVTPARQQGMTGEYIMLEFADWTIKEPFSLFDKSIKMSGKPKDIVVMKDGIINLHHFEDRIGVQFGLKQVGKAEKDKVIETYEKWRADKH